MALPWSIEQWLAHQTQVHPHPIDLGLGRLLRVLERLEWHPPRVPVISVAGTNGKGSVSAYCASILKAAGYRVGTFTSPHLRDYRERIRLHDRLVTHEELAAAFEQIERARLIAPEISLTFFEYNTLAAFLIFASQKMHAWVLEVGMGGRLDAVNAVDPTVAVVVSIGLDHQEFLGATREAIAVEKAGIFRAHHAAVLGSCDMQATLTLLAEAAGAIPKRLGVEFSYNREGGRWHYRGSHWDLRDLPTPALAGRAQFDNAATAIAALEELPAPVAVSAAAVAQGLASVRLAGRFQVIDVRGDGPIWILDVAHNPDAARVLAQNLRDLPCAGRSFAVCAILADKDAAGIATELDGCFDAWWLASIDGPRGSRAAELAERISHLIAAPIHAAADVAEACAAASSAATAGDRVVVFGSFHTVGPALDWLESHVAAARDSTRIY